MMRRKRDERHIIDMIFVLALFALFAVASVLLIAIGVSVYRQGAEAMSENSTVRTSYAYVSEKIRRADAEGAVACGSLGESDALLLSYESNGVSYTTTLYVYEGMLTELVARSGLTFPPSAGQPVAALNKMKCQQVSENLIKITLVETDGEERSLYAHVRSKPSAGEGE